MTKPIIALDIDGVTLDYKAAYARKWAKAFGYHPKVKDATAHKLWEHFDIPFLSDKEAVAKLDSASDDEFWRNMPAIPRSVDAVRIIRAAGYDTISVSAAPGCQRDNRAHNLTSHGYEFEDVICIQVPEAISPKTNIINTIKPAYFVDDYINYFHGIVRPVQKVLINSPKNNPSEHVDMAEMDYVFDDLYGFARWLYENDNRA